MKSRAPSCALLCALLLPAFLLAAGPARAAWELTFLVLDQGRTDENRIAAPVYESPVEPLAIEPVVSRLAPGHELTRRLTGRMPRYHLGAGVDPGAALTMALQTEGTAMGLRVSSSGAGGWTVGGTLDDLYMEARPVIFGPVLFYGYMHVTLTARGPAGEPRTLRYRLHNMHARYNGGFGLQDEVGEVVAQFLVESAQEIIARLNRDLIHAPAHPSIAARLGTLGAISGREAELRAIGLSGSPAAVPVLLARLPGEPNEAARVNIIDALASLGAPEAVESLAGRYAGEDEDCRYFTLKAWDYIGGEEAARHVAGKGESDPDKAARQLALRIGAP